MDQTINEGNAKLKAENKVLKRQIEWMQETIDKLNIKYIEDAFGINK